MPNNDAVVHEMKPVTVTESLATDRQTGWFAFTDLGKKVFVRRINATYSSPDEINFKVYVDGDDVNEVFSGAFRANSGDTGVNVDFLFSSGHKRLYCSDTNQLLKVGDWIKVENEIVKIVDVETPSGVKSVDTITDLGNNADGIYPDTTLTGGSGTGAEANVQVTGGVITSIEITYPGHGGYEVGEELTIPPFTLGSGLGGTMEIEFVTDMYTVQRGMRGTTAVAHQADTDIYYANYPFDSFKIGGRAKYAQVQLSTSSSTNPCEISSLEIEYE
ncbi:MAG: hypothetical protein QF704_07720 [Anaerolineales bacterium]|jgi:hypothetical protein|nr:hypothetical protein [Anaerolineales bacterium]